MYRLKSKAKTELVLLLTMPSLHIEYRHKVTLSGRMIELMYKQSALCGSYAQCIVQY